MIAVTKNELLLSLPASEQQQLDRHLRPVTLRCGSVLHEMGHSIERVYFPETGAKFYFLVKFQWLTVHQTRLVRLVRPMR
jgi:hypothetical protein